MALDFIAYFASERLGLSNHVIDKELNLFRNAIDEWKNLIEICFLSDKFKEKYMTLLEERCRRLLL